MSDVPDAWERFRYTATAGRAFLFYVVFGGVEPTEPLSAKRYRSAGMPVGLELVRYERGRHAEYIDGFLEGYVWDELQRSDPRLAAAVRDASSSCLVLRGEVPDPPSLAYLRDAVGLLTYLLDHGGVVVYDPQTFRWWSPDQWRADVFEPDSPSPDRHVVILVSEESTTTPGRLWVHTRGMRKFARPDISVHNVPPSRLDAVAEMCNRFVDLQAFGGVIAEGTEVRMSILPPGGFARHGGDLEDPDFNNVHVEILWPAGL